MKPAKFPEANKKLGPPKGMTKEQCGDLHTFSDGVHSVSLWKMSWRERIAALFFGKVWLVLMSGSTQPPAFLRCSRTYLKRVETRKEGE